MKYLKNLPTHDFYESFINGEQFEEIQESKKDVISFCKQAKHVHYNPYIPPPPSPPKALDILYSDNNGNLSYTSEVLPTTDGKVPIALCIAPEGFFGTNERARWMSLKYMNYTTPEIGSLNPWGISFGTGGANLGIPYIEYAYDGGASAGYMNVDYYDNTSQSNKIPSPLTANDEWNSSILGTVNEYAMTDINGKNKTAIIISNAISQSTWQTDTSITNDSGSGYAPAACCCYRYHTLGTQAGDWYLGGCGEMSIILARKTSINTKLAAIYTIYPNVCIDSLYSAYYWTSTSCDAWGVYYVSTYNANVTPYENRDANLVMALLQY